MSLTKKSLQNKIHVWLSLSAGILLVIFGLIALFLEVYFLSEITWINIIPLSGDAFTANILSILSGTIIFLMSLFMFAKPNKTRILGVVIVIFSVVACFGMGIFTIGGIIGITGGTFAVLEERKKGHG